MKIDAIFNKFFFIDKNYVAERLKIPFEIIKLIREANMSNYDNNNK